MKCPINNKYCKASVIFQAKGKRFICSGINNKPSKYKKDNIHLCVQGDISKTEHEMTVEEAGYITAALATSVAFLAPAIITKPKIK